jgi:adenylate cyclase
MTKKLIISFLFVLLVSGITFGLHRLGVFEKPELNAYDVQAKYLRADKVPDSTLKVILVDEASLSSMSEIAGRWPWPRAIWADLLDFLSLGGARAVIFDILFLERQDEMNDGVLIDATMASQNVYHSMMIRREEPDLDERNNEYLDLAMPIDFVNRFALLNVTGSPISKPGTENNVFALPIPGLPEASKGMSVVEFRSDDDGVYRRTSPLRDYQGTYYPVLGLAPFIDDTSVIFLQDDSITINDRTIPLDENGNCMINMYDLDRVDTYSMSGVFASLQMIREGDIENLLVNPEVFQDAVVFVAVSAVGGADLKPIPVTSSAPGVMLHVFLANNYLQNDFMTPPDKRLTYLSILLAAFLTCWAVLFNKRLFSRTVLPLTILVIYIGFALFSFTFNMMVDVVPFIFATVSSTFLSFGYLTFTEAAEKRKVSHLFTQYVSKDVLNEVLHNYKEYLKSSAGQKVELTVLFSDIRGFTTISETTPPEKIVEMLNVHFSVMAEIILRHNGTIDKYIGDAIMAFWGAPVRTEDHAEQAVLAAVEMIEGLNEVNRTLKERGFGHEVMIGIGINTGLATIGNIGSEQKKNYTVVGDAVNLSSRIEGLTKEYKTPVLFSEYTFAKIRDKMSCKLIGNVKVKGREQPVNIYTKE